MADTTSQGAGQRDACHTVADLIDRWIALHNTRPDKAANGDNGTRDAHIEQEKQAADELERALCYYGPVVWRGQVWWQVMPPRVYQINHTPFGGFGKKLPWPPVRQASPDPATPEVPEKVAGYVSENKFSQ